MKYLPLMILSCLFSYLSNIYATDRAASVNATIDQWNEHLSVSDRASKFCKMASSPYYFYRGSNHLFWQDFADDPRLSQFSTTQTAIWIQGDLHAYNFGAFANDEGVVVYDLNDFDESVIADYQYDIWRMATSLVLIAEENGLSDTAKTLGLDDFSEAYLDAMANYHGNSKENTTQFTKVNSYGRLDNFLNDVEDDNSRKEMLDDWTQVLAGEREFDDSSPKLENVSSQQRQAIIQAMPAYGATLSGGLNYNSGYFKVKDIAKRLLAGTGSLGSERYYVLIEGNSSSNNDDHILDIKQQGKATPHYFITPSPVNNYVNDAARHMIAYKALGYKVDDHLGWMALNNGYFSVRERSPYKESFPAEKLTSATRFRKLAEQWGTILATAHARADKDAANSGINYSVDKAIDEATDGRHKDFRALVRAVAFAYSQQVNEDYIGFIEALSISCL